MSLKKKLLTSAQESMEAIEQLTHPQALTFLEQGVHLLAACFRAGKKVLIAGNGGSLCDALHFAEELTGYFRQKRRALPAIALADPGHLTCVGNDTGFAYIFSRAIEAYGQPGDLFIGLTTSGNSPNLLEAFSRAHKMGLKTIAFLGKGGGHLKGKADLELVIDRFKTSDRIQEAHMSALHILIEGVEEVLFGQSKEEILEDLVAAVRA